jgi:chromosome segregation ATPase
MVFLTRMRESETELKTLREETAGMRGEVEDKRGVWFDRARKDVERVVQNAMKRAEDAEAALEAATGASEQRVEEWTKTLEMTRTKLEETLKENDALAMKAAEAMNAESDAAAALRQSESELRDAVDRASESAHAAKAATDAMAAAREELGVLRMEHRRAREELQLAEGTV